MSSEEVRGSYVPLHQVLISPFLDLVLPANDLDATPLAQLNGLHDVHVSVVIQFSLVLQPFVVIG